MKMNWNWKRNWNGKGTEKGTDIDQTKNQYGLTAGQCELPAREMERKTTMERTQNLYGLTAGQCEFYPQGNEKWNMTGTR